MSTWSRRVGMRELSRRTGAVLAQLRPDRPLLITHHGQPVAVLSALPTGPMSMPPELEDAPQPSGSQEHRARHALGGTGDAYVAGDEAVGRGAVDAEDDGVADALEVLRRSTTLDEKVKAELLERYDRPPADGVLTLDVGQGIEGMLLDEGAAADGGQMSDAPGDAYLAAVLPSLTRAFGEFVAGALRERIEARGSASGTGPQAHDQR